MDFARSLQQLLHGAEKVDKSIIMPTCNYWLTQAAMQK